MPSSEQISSRGETQQPATSPVVAKKGVLLLFALWVVMLAGAYWYFMVKPKQWFDAAMQQPPLLADPLQQQALRDFLKQRFPTLQADKSWFVRVKQAGCGCERFVELYHKSFTARADDAKLQVVSLDLAEERFSEDQKNLLLKLIPATPAVVLLDPKGVIAYFGPYHQEGICSADNSYLEPVLAALQQGRNLSVLNTLVFGCFCPTH